jgi:hypothetical protein
MSRTIQSMKPDSRTMKEGRRRVQVALGFEGHFRYMVEYCWTIREIRASFRVPTAIARHIQEVGQDVNDALAIMKAHDELANGQIGF